MQGSLRIPRHVAVVMDGNGRWAKNRYMPRFFGHKAGVDTLIRAIDLFADRGVEYLTVFAFSSENWKRPADEVSGLFGLVLVAASKYLESMVSKGVRIRVIGSRKGVSDRLLAAWTQAEAATAHNRRITVLVAFNFGGRWDVVQACRRALQSGLAPDALDEESFARLLTLSDAPDPDLFIRTGGEMRLSNFLLWQAAYAELYFTDCLWPDFDAAQIDLALASFAVRDRRFGAAESWSHGPDVAG
ncbi:MAG: polyprenyl diphosphate synthase [Rubrivivax sp.]|jgi:undecaprenyl diphosphate synthase